MIVKAILLDLEAVLFASHVLYTDSIGEYNELSLPKYYVHSIYII